MDGRDRAADHRISSEPVSSISSISGIDGPFYSAASLAARRSVSAMSGPRNADSEEAVGPGALDEVIQLPPPAVIASWIAAC